MTKGRTKMKEKLILIFNNLKMIETKGDSTVLMADCLKALVGFIQEMPDDTEETDE